MDKELFEEVPQKSKAGDYVAQRVKMSRREDRKPLILHAICRTSAKKHPIVLTDLSTRGCKLQSFGLALSAGQSVIIKPEGLEGLLGTVRWVEADCAGIEFDYPLHPAVKDHLCRTHAGDHGV